MVRSTTYRIVRVISVFVAVLAANSLEVYSQATVDRFIAQQAAKEAGDEYAGARKTLLAGVDGGNIADLVVLFTLEGFHGGNNHRQYLAVFLRHGKSYRYAVHGGVGGKLNRSVDLASVTNGTINLDTKEYRKNDPACCPTRNGKTRYRLIRGKLREIG
jgi:hypothetical protein